MDGNSIGDFNPSILLHFIIAVKSAAGDQKTKKQAESAS